MTPHFFYLEHKRTLHDVFWRMLQVASQQGIVLFLFILCGRFLSPNDFGIYNYTLAIVLFLVMFGDFGISLAASKYVAEYNATNREKIASIPFNAGLAIVGFGVVISALVFLFGPRYLGSHFQTILYLLPLVFLTPLVSLYDGIYRGLRQFRYLTAISSGISIVFAPLAYYLVKFHGISGALLAQDIFYLLLFVGLCIGYRQITFQFDTETIKRLLKYSIIVGIGSVGFFFFGKIDTIFLGSFGYIPEIGYIEILNKIFGVLGTFPLILASVIGPTIAGLYAKNEHDSLKKKLDKYILLSFCIAVVGSVLFLLFGKYLIEFAFPKYYDATMLSIIPLYSILLFSYLFVSIIPSGFAVYTGHAKLSAYFLIGFGVIHVVLNYFFILNFGFFGIIYSILLTRVPSDLLFIYAYRKILLYAEKVQVG
ncbi:MAG: oligosaccharide flippase family protein [bacterium]|nr:oligosaccharide flippase family protein [bacterium]